MPSRPRNHVSAIAAWIVTMGLGVATSAAATPSNGMPASGVLGAANFVTHPPAATTASQFNLPYAVALDPATGKLFVSDQDNNRVLRWSSPAAMMNGSSAEAVLGQPDFVTSTALIAQNGMFQPRGVYVDAGGRLWVAEQGNNRVLRFDNASSKASGANADGVLGQATYTTATSVTTQTGMRGPNDVYLDAGGRLWVADVLSNRVLRFDNAAALANGAPASGVLGQPDFITSTFGLTQAKMANPRGVHVDAAGRLWIADTANHRVLRFDNAAALANGSLASGVLGQPNFTTGLIVCTQSGTASPTNVRVDASGRLYAADTGNNRIVVFDNAAALANGAPATYVIGQPTFTSSTVVNPPTANSLHEPRGLMLDEPNGMFWVGDLLNNRVLRYVVAVPEIVVEQPVSTNIADGGSRSFGSVAVGNHASLTFTIRNTGEANLTNLVISFTGPDAAQFSITAGPTAPVSGPTGSTTFTARFTPANIGAKSAVLHIANNDPDENAFDISLSGTGTGVVGVPSQGALELALDGVRPNPSRGRDLNVAFTLPASSLATLELVDVRGRRMFVREVGSLGAGPHTMKLDGGRKLGAGLYWLRLVAGEQRRISPIVVLE